MKTTLLLLGICLAASTVAKADNFSPRVATAPIGKKPVAQAPAKPKHQVTYITNVSVTGSYIPLVVTRYGDHVYPKSAISVYGQPQLDQTGQLNVGAQLIQRDPAITAGPGRR